MHKDLRIEEIARLHRGNLLPMLKQLQTEFGYLQKQVLKKLAKETGIPLSQIYATATFYSLLTTKEKGQYVIRICESPSCELQDKEEILTATWEELGIIPRETTRDRKFSLEFSSCLGQCDKGPALMVNGDTYTNVKPSDIGEILSRYHLREEVKQ